VIKNEQNRCVFLECKCVGESKNCRVMKGLIRNAETDHVLIHESKLREVNKRQLEVSRSISYLMELVSVLEDYSISIQRILFSWIQRLANGLADSLAKSGVFKDVVCCRPSVLVVCCRPSILVYFLWTALILGVAIQFW